MVKYKTLKISNLFCRRFENNREIYTWKLYKCFFITHSTRIFVQLVCTFLRMPRTRTRSTQCQCRVTLRKLSRRKCAIDVNIHVRIMSICLLATITLMYRMTLFPVLNTPSNKEKITQWDNKILSSYHLIRIGRGRINWTRRILQNVRSFAHFYTAGLGNHFSGCSQIRIFAKVLVTFHAATMKLKMFPSISNVLIYHVSLTIL